MALDTLWYTRCPVPNAFSLAVHHGWLADEFAGQGIRFQSLAASPEASVRQSHFEHTQDNSIRHGGNIPPLVTRDRGRDLRIIGLSVAGSYQPVLALPDSGIRTVADLKGRRIAVPRRLNDPVDFWRATILRGFERILSQTGLTLTDTIPVDVAIGRRFVDDATCGTGQSETLWNAGYMIGHQRDEVAALLRGEVDAIFSQGSIAVITRAVTGAHEVGRLTPVPGDLAMTAINQPFTLTISGALADERPDVAARLVARVHDAAAWAATHEREAKRLIAAETGLPEELVDDAFGADIHRRLDIDLSPQRIAGLRANHDDLLRHGFLGGPVDLDAFIDPRPLAAAAGCAGTV